MSEMIERVAKALYESDGYVASVEQDGFSKPTWAEIHPLNREDMFSMARAAIEAMREPTDLMVHEGVKADGFSSVWPAMIDAALTPPPDTQSAASDKARSPKPA